MEYFYVECPKCGEHFPINLTLEVPASYFTEGLIVGKGVTVHKIMTIGPGTFKVSHTNKCEKCGQQIMKFHLGKLRCLNCENVQEPKKEV